MVITDIEIRNPVTSLTVEKVSFEVLSPMSTIPDPAELSPNFVDPNSSYEPTSPVVGFCENPPNFDRSWTTEPNSSFETSTETPDNGADVDAVKTISVPEDVPNLGAEADGRIPAAKLLYLQPDHDEELAVHDENRYLLLYTCSHRRNYIEARRTATASS